MKTLPERWGCVVCGSGTLWVLIEDYTALEDAFSAYVAQGKARDWLVTVTRLNGSRCTIAVSSILEVAECSLDTYRDAEAMAAQTTKMDKDIRTEVLGFDAEDPA